MSHPIQGSSSSLSALLPHGFIGPRGAFGAAAVTATQTRDLELSITTDEGDVVTLSMHQERELTAASYRDLARHGHGRRAQSLSASFERSVQVRVQGDLNAQEQADVAALVKDLGQVARAFFRDHLDAARRALAQFDELGSLQGFTLELSQERSLTAVAVTAGGIRPAASPLPIGPAPADDAATAVPAGETPVCGAPDCD